ncbi:hypothetical protein E3E29_08165 [Thermococcus sp. Bubb.Bath]|nr:hypothetical protein [Thermococcus sp. Bubb.Bath]
MAGVLHLPENESLRLNGFPLSPPAPYLKRYTPRSLHGQRPLGSGGYPIKKDCVERIETYYLGELHIVDFRSNPGEAENKINRWAEEKTNGRINNLVSGLSPDTRLVLTNAIYFKANWSHRFDPSATHNDTFFLPDVRGVVVPFMKGLTSSTTLRGTPSRPLRCPTKERGSPWDHPAKEDERSWGTGSEPDTSVP